MLPWVPDSFFSCCLRRELSGEAIVTSGKQQEKKKPSGNKGTVIFVPDLK